jgi:hypothetical protein
MPRRRFWAFTRGACEPTGDGRREGSPSAHVDFATPYRVCYVWINRVIRLSRSEQRIDVQKERHIEDRQEDKEANQKDDEAEEEDD